MAENLHVLRNKEERPFYYQPFKCAEIDLRKKNFQCGTLLEHFSLGLVLQSASEVGWSESVSSLFVSRCHHHLLRGH